MNLRLVAPLALFLFSTTYTPSALAQVKERFSVDGYLEWRLHPPRNEVDANLRRPDLPPAGYGSAFARYALRGELYLRFNLDGPVVSDLFILAKPYFLFGNNVPQQLYTYSASPIGFSRHFGAGLTLLDRVEVFIESHRWEWFGEHELGVPANGPEGLWNAVGVRYRFDTRARK